MCLRGSIVWLTIAVLGMGWMAWADENEPPVRYDNYQVVRVALSAWDEVEQIRALGGRLLDDGEHLGVADYLLAPKVVPGFEALGLPYKILNDNLQKSIDDERASIEAAGAVDSRDPTWFQAYKNIDAVNAKLNAMVADRPDLVSLIDLGVTGQNRHVYGVRITGPGSDKPAVLFNGCHHAREWISVMVPMWIADRFVYEYDTDPTIHSLVDRVEFFIVPVVNVDGYVYTWSTDRMWRKNRRNNGGGCYGVDDNRNYATGFGGGGSSSNPCDETYHGPSAFSEPETAAMRDFAIAHPQIVASQSYHSYAELVMSPWGYISTLPPDNDIFMELDAAQAQAIYAVHGLSYGYGPIYTTIYQASGNDVDWYYAHEGIFSFTTELRDTGTYGFELPANQIIPTSEENYAAAAVLSEWSASPIKYGFPEGLPGRLDPSTPATVHVQIRSVGATLDPASLLLYTRVGDSGPFTSQVLTSLGNNLYAGTLPGTPCGRTMNFYFSAATTTGIVGTSPADAPDTLYQATAAPIVVLLDVNMDTNPGWTVQGLWAWGHPTGGGGEYGGPDPNSGHTGTNVYGYNLSGDYENSLPERHLTTGTINCSGQTGIHLSFWRWLGVEQPTYDHAYLRISNNNGSTWTNVWQNTATMYDGAWVYQDYDVSQWANNQANVKLRWTMGVTDGGWRFCGWNIDDVLVWAPDPAGCPFEPGDLNCDGAINNFDITPFVLALTATPPNYPEYYAQYPDCDQMLADINGDGAADNFDISPFVALLVP